MIAGFTLTPVYLVHFGVGTGVRVSCFRDALARDMGILAGRLRRANAVCQRRPRMKWFHLTLLVLFACS
ncbi:MAG TPA: hypothetical protein PLV10_06965, partial [Candidatus Latescibacteria bacterium]|nr:hypothetical protein [Candidatus Latescibacterota bacterium]